jgi:hypothetical protein
MALAGVKVVVLAALGPLHLDPSSVHHAQPPAKNQPACLDQRSRSQIRSIHLVIGPGGVVVIDTKQYRGRLWLDPDGLLWHGRHLLVATLRKVRWAADQADQVLGVADVQVVAIMAVHGAKVPWGQLTADGVIVAPARRMPDLLQALPAILGPERVAWLADRARLRFHAAA